MNDFEELHEFEVLMDHHERELLCKKLGAIFAHPLVKLSDDQILALVHLCATTIIKHRDDRSSSSDDRIASMQDQINALARRVAITEHKLFERRAIDMVASGCHPYRSAPAPGSPVEHPTSPTLADGRVDPRERVLGALGRARGSARGRAVTAAACAALGVLALGAATGLTAVTVLGLTLGAVLGIIGSMGGP